MVLAAHTFPDRSILESKFRRDGAAESSFLLNLLTDNAVPHDLVEALIGLCMALHCPLMLMFHMLHIFRRSVCRHVWQPISQRLLPVRCVIIFF